MPNFITSISDTRNFYEFIGVFRKSLENMYGNDFNLCVNYVTERDESDPIVKRVSEYADILLLHKPLKGMDDGNYAKLLRMINATKIKSDKIILIDSDIIMLNKQFFDQIYNHDISDGLGMVGKNIYADTVDEHKFPMSYCFAKPETFTKIINPKGLETKDLIKSWSTIKGKDGKENPFNPHDKFSDESLFHYLLENTPHEIDTFEFQRPDVNRKYGVAQRVDRVKWQFSRKKFESGYYLDFVPMRPFNEKYETMKELIDIITEDNFTKYKIEDKDLNVGIIGNGFVGSAMAAGFALHAKVRVYDADRSKTIDSLEDVVNKSKYIFLCLPTPMNKNDNSKIDLSIIDSVLSGINKLNPSNDKIVVIKSTVVPGTTDKFARKYPNLNITFNPEFLTERTANLDFINAARIVLGGEQKLVDSLEQLYRARFPYTKIIKTDSKSAEFIKYFANCFFATKVSFMNEMLQASEKFGCNWNDVMNGVMSDGRIGNSHTDVPGHDGSRGFGGKCFPKDINAFINFFKDIGVQPTILEAAWQKNLEVRENHDWNKIPGAVTSTSKAETNGEERLLILVKSHDTKKVNHLNSGNLYNDLETFSRSYSNSFKNVDTYYVKCDPNLDCDYKIDDRDIWVRGEENYLQGALKFKLLKSLHHFFGKNSNNQELYTHVFCTNLTTFVNIPAMYKKAQEIGQSVNPWARIGIAQAGTWGLKNNLKFPSGAGVLFSAQAVKVFLSIEPFIDQSSAPIPDDIFWGWMCKNLDIPLKDLERFDVCNGQYHDGKLALQNIKSGFKDKSCTHIRVKTKTNREYEPKIHEYLKSFLEL